MADEVTTIPVTPVSDAAQEAPDTGEPVNMEADPPSFQERMDSDFSAFRSTYKAHGSSKSNTSDAKVERDKAQVAYDRAMSDTSVSRQAHLEDTRYLIRTLQEHEAALVAEGQA